MKNLAVKHVVKISAYFTAEQWQLYTAARPAECNAIAFALNKTLCEYVNRGETRDTVEVFMHSLMRYSAEYGANDSAAHIFLAVVLDEIFG